MSAIRLTALLKFHNLQPRAKQGWKKKKKKRETFFSQTDQTWKYDFFWFLFPYIQNTTGFLSKLHLGWMLHVRTGGHWHVQHTAKQGQKMMIMKLIKNPSSRHETWPLPFLIFLCGGGEGGFMHFTFNRASFKVGAVWPQDRRAHFTNWHVWPVWKKNHLVISRTGLYRKKKWTKGKIETWILSANRILLSTHTQRPSWWRPRLTGSPNVFLILF